MLNQTYKKTVTVGVDYRNTALAIIRRRDGKILLIFNTRVNSVDTKNIDQNSYKFPQGGIDTGETAEKAIVRELDEELGVDFSNVAVAAHLSDYVSYWFRNVNKPDFEIRLFAFLFEVEEVNEDELKVDPVEVAEMRWVKPEDVKKLELGIRHDVYLSILRRFQMI